MCSPNNMCWMDSPHMSHSPHTPLPQKSGMQLKTSRSNHRFFRPLSASNKALKVEENLP